MLVDKCEKLDSQIGEIRIKKGWKMIPNTHQNLQEGSIFF